MAGPVGGPVKRATSAPSAPSAVPLPGGPLGRERLLESGEAVRVRDGAELEAALAGGVPTILLDPCEYRPRWEPWWLHQRGRTLAAFDETAPMPDLGLQVNVGRLDPVPEPHRLTLRGLRVRRQVFVCCGVTDVTLDACFLGPLGEDDTQHALYAQHDEEGFEPAGVTLRGCMLLAGPAGYDAATLRGGGAVEGCLLVGGNHRVLEVKFATRVVGNILVGDADTTHGINVSNPLGTLVEGNLIAHCRNAVAVAGDAPLRPHEPRPEPWAGAASAADPSTPSNWTATVRGNQCHAAGLGTAFANATPGRSGFALAGEWQPPTERADWLTREAVLEAVRGIVTPADVRRVITELHALATAGRA